MKKILSLIFALLLCLSAFVSCSVINDVKRKILPDKAALDGLELSRDKLFGDTDDAEKLFDILSGAFTAEYTGADGGTAEVRYDAASEKADASVTFADGVADSAKFFINGTKIAVKCESLLGDEVLGADTENLAEKLKNSPLLKILDISPEDLAKNSPLPFFPLPADAAEFGDIIEDYRTAFAGVSAHASDVTFEYSDGETVKAAEISRTLEAKDALPLAERLCALAGKFSDTDTAELLDKSFKDTGRTVLGVTLDKKTEYALAVKLEITLSESDTFSLSAAFDSPELTSATVRAGDSATVGIAKNADGGIRITDGENALLELTADDGKYTVTVYPEDGDAETVTGTYEINDDSASLTAVKDGEGSSSLALKRGGTPDEIPEYKDVFDMDAGDWLKLTLKLALGKITD